MLSDHVSFKSLDRTSCHCNTSNHIRVIESKFMSLDRRPLDQNIQVMPLDRTSCHWIRNVTRSGQRLIEKSLLPRVLFQIRNSKYGGSLAGSTSNSNKNNL